MSIIGTVGIEYEEINFWPRTGNYEGVIMEFCERKYKYYYGSKLNINFIYNINTSMSGRCSVHTYINIYIYILCYYYIRFTIYLSTINVFFAQPWLHAIRVCYLIFLSLQKAINDSGVYWLFAGFCVVNFFFSLFVVKETKGKSIQEISAMFGAPQRQDRKLSLTRDYKALAM